MPYIRRRRAHRFCSDRCRVHYHKHPEVYRSEARLQKAALRILGRLQEGAATNAELLAIGGFRFGARLHELRRAGHRITTEENKATGVAVYTLEVGA